MMPVLALAPALSLCSGESEQERRGIVGRRFIESGPTGPCSSGADCNHRGEPCSKDCIEQLFYLLHSITLLLLAATSAPAQAKSLCV
jgi:hypothetical protein